MADMRDFALVVAEDLNGLEQRVDAVEATAEQTAQQVAATAATVDQIKLANQSAGTGAPTGAAPIGWVYTDLATGDIYRMEA